MRTVLGLPAHADFTPVLRARHAPLQNFEVQTAAGAHKGPPANSVAPPSMQDIKPITGNRRLSAPAVSDRLATCLPKSKHWKALAARPRQTALGPCSFR